LAKVDEEVREANMPRQLRRGEFLGIKSNT